MRKQEQSFWHQTDYQDGIKKGFITPTLDQLIETFLICCGTDGKSLKTITWYEANLKRFSGFLKSRKMEKPVEDIGPAEFRHFIYHLQNEVTRWESYRPEKDDKGLSPYSIIGYARTLKAFWSWLLDEGYIDYNPMLRVKMPKVPKKIIATFTPEQIDKMLSLLNQNTQNCLRNRLIILILLDTGIRLSELTQLDIESINLSQCCFKINGKGNKQRIVPFGNEVRRLLLKYIKVSRPEPVYPRVNQLFLTTTGFPLKSRSIHSMILRLGRQAEISGVRISAHSFRHTFAHQYLMTGGDIFSLQRILGHSSLEMVRNYVNLSMGDVLQQHRKYSPVDNLKYFSQAEKNQYEKDLNYNFHYTPRSNRHKPREKFGNPLL